MSKQVNKKQLNNSKPIRIDKGWHKLLKIEAARHLVYMGDIIEACLAESFNDVIRDLSKRLNEERNAK
jgi:hypothetical protein